MFCSKCGTKNTLKNAQFCTSCGNPVSAAPGNNPSMPDSSLNFRQQNEPRPGPMQPQTKDRKPAVLAALCAALILAGAASAWYFLPLKDRDEPSTDRPGSSLPADAPLPGPDGIDDPGEMPGGNAPPIVVEAPDPAPVPSPSAELPPVPAPEPMPAPQEPPPPEAPPPVEPLTLPEAVFDTDNWVRLTAWWPDRAGNSPTIFERDRNSPVWTMVSYDGSFRIVDPLFSQRGSDLIIGFPTTSSVYTLRYDGTGTFGSERLTWAYETDPIHSLWSAFGTELTYDLQDTMSRYRLVAIRVYWSNGQFAYFYRDDAGDWRMRGRSGGLTSISPSIDFRPDSVIMGFTVSSNYHSYSFFDGGTGVADNESITWNYSYYG